MKKTLLALSLTVIAFTGCTSVLNKTLPPGRMNADGTIRPCHRNYSDAQACGNALFNETVIGKIHAGQTASDVRAIMRHDAERRVVEASNESWGYITNYPDRVMTWITFSDQKVTAITQQPWARE